MAISLSAGVRQSLQSLQSTASLAQTAQGRLSSGKRVNSAVDNPVNFFTAQSLNTRADAFSGLLDGISNSIQTIKSASTGIDGISKLVKSLQSTIKQAQSDAATNKPTTTTSALATAAEVTNTGKDLQSIALDKSLADNDAVTTNNGADSSATAPSGSTATGNLGIANTSFLALQIKSGNNTYVASLAKTATVRDVVNEINKSGLATASIDAKGQLNITGTGSDSITIGLGASTTDDAGARTAAATGANNGALGSLATAAVTATGNSTIRANLVQQYSDVRAQIDQLAKDAGFNGSNLLNGDKLRTVFNEKTGNAQSKLDVQGSKVSADNLGILDSANSAVTGKTNFQNDADLSAASDALNTALATLSNLSSTLGASLSVVQTRQDFSKALVDVLKNGADNLVNADTNEEGANLLALQTRQSLSQTALSLSAQADQAVLKLF